MRKSMGTIKLYTNFIARKIAKSLGDESIILGGDELQIGYDRLFSSKTIRRFYYVKMLPISVPVGLAQNIRKVLSTISPRVSFHMETRGRRHAIDWTSSEMKSRQRVWKAREAERSSQMTLDNFASMTEKDMSNWEDWRIMSWNYVQDAEKRFCSLIDCEIFFELEVQGRTPAHNVALDKASALLEQYCARINIQIKRVNNILADFMKYSSPMINSLEDNISARGITNRLLTDEIVADFASYTPGRIEGAQVLLGVDIMTGMPVYKEFTRSNGEAENMIVTAETGGGKSFLCKVLLSMLNFNNYNLVILDADGEYVPLAKKLGGTVLDMSKGAGLYFDSSVIGDLTGVDSVDATLYTEARIATLTLFSTLCDSKEPMTSAELHIFNAAYNAILSEVGVIESNKATWVNSKHLSYHLIYQRIKTLTIDASYSAERRSLIDKLSIFFEPDGLFSYMFREKISLADLLPKGGSHHVVDIVLNLSPEGTASAGAAIEETIKQVTTIYLCNLLTNYFKSMKQFTMQMIEEYQRYSSAKGTGALVLTLATGNRKKNAGMILATNSPRALIDSESEANKAIVDNINNYVVGALKPASIDSVCEEFNLETSKNILQSIANDPAFQHCFLVKINGVYSTIIKQFLSEDIAKSDLFKTRDTVKI